MILEVRIDKQTVEIISKVQDFFKDYEKTNAWMRTKNPFFGHLSPIFLINRGRGHKVLQFIDNAKEGNLP